MARPPNADADATKSRIVQAATRLFARQGREGASVRDIAAEADVAMSLVNHYFGGKDALYRDVLLGIIEELATLRSALGRELVEPSGDPRALVDRAMRVAFRFAREHQDAVLLMQRSFLETGAIDAEVRRKSVVPFLDFVSTAFGARFDKEARPYRAKLQSVTFLAVRYAIAPIADLAAITGRPADDARAILAELEDHLAEAAIAILL